MRYVSSYVSNRNAIVRRAISLAVTCVLIVSAIAPLITIAAPPSAFTVDAVTPGRGPTAGGNTVTIKGSGLSQPNWKPWTQPALTADSSPQGTVTASNATSGTSAFMAFDGKITAAGGADWASTSWYSADPAPGWLYWQLPYQIKVSSLNMISRYSATNLRIRDAAFYTDNTKAQPLGAPFVATDANNAPNVVNLVTPQITQGIYLDVLSTWGVAGVGVNEIKITADYAAAPDVTFGGIPATNVVVVDDETIICTVPAHASGWANVAVTIDGDTVTRSNGYLYTEITAINRNYGRELGGETVKVTLPGMLPDVGEYVQNGLILHLDALQNTRSGHAATSTVWEDLTGNAGGSVNDFALTNKPTILNRSLGFNGSFGASQSAQSISPINLTSYDSVTAEAFFRNSVTNAYGMVFEHTIDWNNQTGGFGAHVNTLSSSYQYGMTHTNFRPNATGMTTMPRNYIADNGTNWTLHTNVFSRIALPNGRLAWVDSKANNPVLINSTLPITAASTQTNAGGQFANARFYLASRAGTGGFWPGQMSSLRLYNRALTQKEVEQNYRIDQERLESQIEIFFDGVPATGVTILDDNTLTCVTPAHAVGKVDLKVVVDGLVYSLPLSYEYIPAVNMSYNNQSCSTCHYGDLHKEHQQTSCYGCHTSQFAQVGSARVTNWSHTPYIGMAPSEQSCGVDTSTCHLTGGAGGNGQKWHGHRPADMAVTHKVAAGSTACSGSACHRTGSGTTPFFFGDMDLAQSHRDYAWAHDAGRTTPGAEVAADIKAGGCAVCHDRDAGNSRKLKPFALSVKTTQGANISCASCHNSPGTSYMPGQTLCLKTPFGSSFAAGLLSGAGLTGASGAMGGGDPASGDAQDVQGILSKLSPETRLFFSPGSGQEEALKPSVLLDNDYSSGQTK